MDWVIESRGGPSVAVTASDSFFSWLLGSFPDVPGVDPYRDARFEGAIVLRWRDSLRGAVAALEAVALAAVTAGQRLPRDPEVRRRVIATLVERDLSSHPHLPTLRELLALLDLAHETGSAVRALGD